MGPDFGVLGGTRGEIAQKIVYSPISADEWPFKTNRQPNFPAYITSWEAITKNRCPSSVSRCLSNPRLEPQSTKIGTNPHRAAKWGCVRPHGPRSCFYRARACAWVYLGPPSNRGHQAKRLRATRDHRPVANNSAKKKGSATHAGHTGPCTPDSPCARLKTLIRAQGHLETSR